LTVAKAWIEPGLNEKGYLVCKFAFTVCDILLSVNCMFSPHFVQRLEGQKPLPEIDDGSDSSSLEEDGTHSEGEDEE
jgi:hypothetical protein